MKEPVFHGAYIAPTAIVNGDVTLQKDVNVWYGAVIRGDMGAIQIGEGTNIQDNCVVHEAVTIGKNCTVGHGAIVHGCTVGDNCLIGMGAIVLNGAVLGDNCLVGAGALVTGKICAEPGSVILGNPAKVVKQLAPGELASTPEAVAHYLEAAKAVFERK